MNASGVGTVGLLLALATIITALGAPIVGIYIARTHRGVDKVTERKITEEVAQIAEERAIEREESLQRQVNELQRVNNERWKRLWALERYVDQDIPWHREARTKLAEAGIILECPQPELPKFEDS